MIPFLGPAILAAILHVVYPDRYGVLNNKLKEGIGKVGLWPPSLPENSLAIQYEAVNPILVELAETLGIDLWTLDYLWWFVAGRVAMIAYVVVEGDQDVDLFKKILPPGLCEQVTFITGGGVEGVQSIARSLVTTRPWPVAIVIDAGSWDSEAIRIRRESVADVVGSVAGRVPFEVIVAVPELKVIFFEATATLSRLYPDVATKPYIFEVAKENVRTAFRLLDKGKSYADLRAELLNELNDDDLPSLRKTQVISELIEFLESCRAHRVTMRIEIRPGVPFNIQPLKEPDGFSPDYSNFGQQRDLD